MGVTNFPDGVNIGSEGGATALWQLGGTSVNVTADELNAIAVAGGLSGAELDVLDGAVAGTATASKAFVFGAAKDIDTIDFSAAGTPFKIAGVAVKTGSTELNYLDTTTPGTAVASKALVFGAAKDIDVIDFSGEFKIDGVAMSSSAAELNYLDTSVPGTAVASKALVLGAAKDVDILDFAGTGGTAFKVAGTAVTLTAAEFNLVDGLTAGTATASKAVVLGAVKDIDTLDFASAAGVKIAGVSLTASMAELNTLAGLLGAKALSYDSATPQVVASGSTAITGAGTVATGLAGGAVGQIVASIANAGTIAPTGDPLVVYARATGSEGSVIFECYGLDGNAASNAGTVNWIAIGTAA